MKKFQSLIYFAIIVGFLLFGMILISSIGLRGGLNVIRPPSR